METWYVNTSNGKVVHLSIRNKCLIIHSKIEAPYHHGVYAEFGRKQYFYTCSSRIIPNLNLDTG